MGGRASREVSTRAAVEMALVVAFVGFRSIALLQAGAAVAAGSLQASTNPTLDLVFLGAAAAESAAVFTYFVRRRTVLPPSWIHVLDYVFALVALWGMTLYSAPPDRIASWLAWSFSFTCPTAGLVGCSLARLRSALLASLGLAAMYASSTVVPALGRPGTDAITGLVNACAYLAFAGAVWYFARFIRGLASQADESQRRIAELERERNRAVVHDMLGYLRLDRLVEADEQARDLMVRQALSKYRQMRSYVDGTDELGDLEGCLRSVADLNAELNLELDLRLEAAVRLDEMVARQLHQAVDTALSNVRQHAPRARVILSASTAERLIDVRVVDDGPGFDLTTAVPGYGLTETIGRQVASVGGRGRVLSRPGGGTEVHISMPAVQP